MGSRVTIKGQVTIAKSLRDAAKIAPGDKVEMALTSSGGVVLFKEGTRGAYLKRLRAASGTAKTDLSADDILALTRGGD